ncbi:MAG: DMT family transporter [Sneathiellaceae bacterium]
MPERELKPGRFAGAAGAAGADLAASDVPGDRRQDRVLFGIVLVVLAALTFPLLNASVKYLTAFYPLLMIICIRYLTHAVFTSLAFFPRYGWRLFWPSRPVLQLARSLLLLGATACFFNAVATLPLTTASTIAFTGPLMITALSVPLLGEKVGIYRWTAVAIGFCGAVVVVQPWSGGPQAETGGPVPLLAALSAFGSALCYAFYQIAGRKLAAHDPPETSICVTAIVAVAVTGIASFFFVDWAPVLTWWHYGIFAATGLFGGFGHYFVTRALVYAPASVLSPFDYAQLLGATLLGFFVFGDFPDIYTWIGAAIIVGSGMFITWREYRLSVARRHAAAVLV